MHGFIVQNFVGLFADQNLIALGDGHLFAHGSPAKRFAKDIAKVHHAHAAAGLTRDVEHRHRV